MWKKPPSSPSLHDENIHPKYMYIFYAIKMTKKKLKQLFFLSTCVFMYICMCVPNSNLDSIFPGVALKKKKQQTCRKKTKHRVIWWRWVVVSTTTIIQQKKTLCTSQKQKKNQPTPQNDDDDDDEKSYTSDPLRVCISHSSGIHLRTDAIFFLVVAEFVCVDFVVVALLCLSKYKSPTVVYTLPNMGEWGCNFWIICKRVYENRFGGWVNLFCTPLFSATHIHGCSLQSFSLFIYFVCVFCCSLVYSRWMSNGHWKEIST